MTRDCQPKVLSRKPYWLAILFAFIGMVVLVTWRIFGTEPVGDRRILRDLEPFRTVMEWIDPTPPPPPLMVMGTLWLDSTARPARRRRNQRTARANSSLTPRRCTMPIARTMHRGGQ